MAVLDRSTLRIALRTLARHRGFTVVAVVSLAVAIALNTVMYSVLDAMLDPRIDAIQPDHLYSVRYYGDYLRRLNPNAVEEALQDGIIGFQGATGSRGYSFRTARPLVEYGPRYSRVNPSTVRANYFEFLGTHAIEGRTFSAADERDGYQVGVISHRLARKLFPDESPIGKTVNLDGTGIVVIGVVIRNSTFAPLYDDMWLLRPAGTPVVPVNLVRLRDKIDDHDLAAQLKLVASRLALAAGEAPGTTAFRGRSFVTRQFTFGAFHFALMGAVAAVLLVACANLANLQLARGLARTRELALRSAVGASRSQLVGHLLIESGILAAAGLVVGVMLTFWGIRIVDHAVPPQMNNYMIEPQTSWRVFAFATVAALVCLFLVGLVPALRVSRVDPDTLLKSGSGTGANRAHRKRYGMMVVAQIGFALPVLIGAIVVLRSAWQLHSRDYVVRNWYGYDPSPMVAGSAPVAPTTAKMVRLAGIANELTAEAKTIPGVLDLTIDRPAAPVGRRVTVDDENGVTREAWAHQWTYHIVSPSYFRVFGRTMERGRDFGDGEFDGQSVIMDGPTARYLWGNQNPIGRSIKLGEPKSDLPWLRVVGIVGDMRDTFALRRADPYANYQMKAVYRVVTPQDSILLPRLTPREQGLANIGVFSFRPTVSFYARVRGSTELAAVRLQRQFRDASTAERPTVIPMDEEVGIDTWRVRNDFVASLFSTFALLGLGLVAIGVYGIVSHTVEERRRELAVRISLGATTRDILHAVLREGNVLILSGVAIGLLFTKYTIGWLGVFWGGQNDGYNAPLFAFIAAGLFALAVLSAFRPAWRATRIDPVEALRHE